MANSAGKIASIIRRTDSPVGALASKEEAEFVEKLQPRKGRINGKEVLFHSSIVLKGEQTIVNFPTGTKKVYQGKTAQDWIRSIAEREGILITL